MDEISKKKIFENIFYKSRNAIENFDTFKWHRNQHNQIDTDKVYSSQALAIDVFGFLKLCKDKDELINNLFGIEDKNWVIEFEFYDKDLLNEKKSPTQIDVKIEGEKNILIFECKFTETEGRCTQISKNNHKNVPQCNGNYELQTNPINGIESFCALAGKGIKYWDYIKEIYTINTEDSCYPCPFKTTNYQWMRNLCTIKALAERNNKNAKFYICYADFDFCPMKKKIDNDYLKKLNSIIKSDFKIYSISYQNIIEHGCKYSIEKESWLELKGWIEQKGHNTELIKS